MRTSLLTLADSYGAATEKTHATIGKLALNDNTFLARIERGDGFNVKTFDRMVQWFSDNWPENAEWPGEIERPDASKSDAAA